MTVPLFIDVPCIVLVFVYNQLMHKYISQYFSLYTVFTLTCFDISVSSSGSFKLVLR